MNIQAVIFDLDDTLYPERDYVLSGYRAVSRHLQETLGRGDDFAAWMWGEFLRGETARAFNRLSDHFALGLDDSAVARCVFVYRHHRPQIGPRAGTLDLLDTLASAGKRLGLLSDGFLPAQRLKLSALGLDHRFESVVFTEDLGRDAWKPSPAGFEKIVADLSVPHAACAYVADNPSKDFVAPNALGWRTIQYRFNGQLHWQTPAADGGTPQHVATSCDELLHLLT